jgi:protein arginine kinase activator
MKCDICKVKEATVHLTEIINKKVTKLHLCEECAKEKSLEMEEHFGLADLLSGLADLAPVKSQKEDMSEIKIKCPKCAFTFQDFRKMGRLGCPECYETFSKQLDPLLRKIHGSDRHTGKMLIQKATVKNKDVIVRELKDSLSKAIRKEEFEQAARLRDQIKAIEGGVTKNEN